MKTFCQMAQLDGPPAQLHGMGAVGSHAPPSSPEPEDEPDDGPDEDPVVDPELDPDDAVPPELDLPCPLDDPDEEPPLDPDPPPLEPE
jgi:hypothetical protein